MSKLFPENSYISSFEYEFKTDAKKTYIGLDYSSNHIKYIKVWISTYKIDGKYLFKRDLDKLYSQFNNE